MYKYQTPEFLTNLQGSLQGRHRLITGPIQIEIVDRHDGRV
jgi:hypothetical protein